MLVRWRKFYRLPRSSQKLFIIALCALAIAVIAIRLFRFQRIHSASKRYIILGKVSGRNLVENLRAVQETARMVQAASNHGPFPGNCLNRSVVLWYLLRRRGFYSDLRIGVRKHAGRVEAHAWVEWAGQVLNDLDNVHERFVAFERPIVSAEAEIK